MSIEVINFGCRLNSYEGEVIKKQAQEAGLESAIIFNSCAVTSEAERQVRQAIRRARKENPDVKIIVTGCSAQTHPDMYNTMQEVDKVLGNQEKLGKNSYMFGIGESEKVQVNDIMSVKETATVRTSTASTCSSREQTPLRQRLVKSGCSSPAQAAAPTSPQSRATAA